MNELFSDSLTAGVVISLLAYFLGDAMKRKWKLAIFNPLLISIVLVIVFLLLFGVDYQAYYGSAKYLSYLLTPATVSLAIPVYQKLSLLKKHAAAIFIGVLSGVLASIASVLVLCCLFRLSCGDFATLLPKSITTAIGIGVSQELGGNVSITAASIVLTGVFGNIIAETACRVFRFRSSISRGLAIGTASHAIGASKAMELGEVEGAVSSLAIVVAGILTVLTAPLFTALAQRLLP